MFSLICVLCWSVPLVAVTVTRLLFELPKEKPPPQPLIDSANPPSMTIHRTGAAQRAPRVRNPLFRAKIKPPGRSTASRPNGAPGNCDQGAVGTSWAVGEALMVNVVVAILLPGVRTGWVNCAVSPDAKPERVNCTGLANPSAVGARLMVMGTGAPPRTTVTVPVGPLTL